MDKPTRKKPRAVTILRGIACIPCAILAGFLLDFILRTWIYDNLVDNTILVFLPDCIVGAMVDFLGSIILGGAMTAIAAKVAPSGQKVVGLCFTTALGVIATFSIIALILSSDYITIVAPVGIMVGAIAINIYFHEKDKAEDVILD